MKRAFPHDKDRKHHGRRGEKKFRDDSDTTSDHTSAAGDQRDDRDSDSDTENMETEEMTGVIDKLGEHSRGRPAGLVTFTLKSGERAIGKFSEEQSFANGFRLWDMRTYTSNQSLTFPFRVGMPVKIMSCKQQRSQHERFSYVVDIQIGGEDGPGSPLLLEDLTNKNIANYDGAEVKARVKAFEEGNGIATFTKDRSASLLTHFTVQSIRMNGLEVHPGAYSHVVFVGMTISLKITSSSSKNIPGIYYTADMVLDIPTAYGGEEALQEAEEYRGVVLKAENNTPVLLSCSIKGSNKSFFVACEKVTLEYEPIVDSSLDFSEGTSIMCSLRFKHKYPKIDEGWVYLATANMPITMCKIKKLIYIRGILLPRSVVTTIEGANRQVLINRSGIKVNGKKPAKPFPQNFFRVEMWIPINDLWAMNKFNYRATFNASTNILNKTLRIEEGGTSMESTISAALKEMPPSRFPLKPNAVLGVISGVRENSEGRALPSEVSALIEEKEQKIFIPDSQVFVNGKTEMYLPSTVVCIGGKIKVHNVKFSEDNKRYEGKLLYFFPKAHWNDLFGASETSEKCDEKRACSPPCDEKRACSPPCDEKRACSPPPMVCSEK